MGLKFVIVEGEVPYKLCICTEFRLHLCNSIRVTKSFLKDCDQDLVVGKVNSAIADMEPDLVSSIIK